MLVHSQILGKGTPLIILHGFLGMGDNWRSLGNRFAELGFQVHLIDQRNHGRSFHSNHFSYADLASDIVTYCEHYTLKNIYVLGHSMGGKTAMFLSTIFPELVSKLIVADISPKAYPLHHQIILKALSSLNFSELKTRGSVEQMLIKYIQETPTIQFLMKNVYWKSKEELALRINLPSLIRNIEEVGKALPEDSIFYKDTLFLRGANSNYIEVLDELLIVKHFPKAKIKTVSNAGHWLHAENSEDFYQYVVDFL